MNRFAHMSVAALAALPLYSSTLSAAPVTTIVLNDTFDAPDATPLDDANDPLDVAYYGFSGNVGVQDQTLRVSPSSANSRFGSATFSPVSIANGGSVTLRFDVRADRGGQAAILGLNLGLYNSGGTGAVDASSASRDAAANDQGVLLHLWDDASNFYSSTVRIDETGQTLDGESGAFVGGYRFADGATHTYEIVITKAGWGSTIKLSYDGVVMNTTTLGSSVTTFDNIQFGTGTTPFAFELDNLFVASTTVPEPTTLGAIALAAGLLRRRR